MGNLLSRLLHNNCKANNLPTKSTHNLILRLRLRRKRDLHEKHSSFVRNCDPRLFLQFVALVCGYSVQIYIRISSICCGIPQDMSVFENAEDHPYQALSFGRNIKFVVLQWIQNPTPLSVINQFDPWNCATLQRPLPCNKPNVCPTFFRGGMRYIRTCEACPESYPWIKNTNGASRTQPNAVSNSATVS